MSMRALTKLIQDRVDEATRQSLPSSRASRERLHVHEARKVAAQLLSTRQCAQLLKSKALEAATRPSTHPMVTITPEMAMVLAQALAKK